MSELYYAGQSLTPQIETSDATLSSHTNREILYIFTGPDGESDAAVSLTGLVTASSIMYAEIGPLEEGSYKIWSESDDTNGKHCVSDSLFIPVSSAGTVKLA